MKNLYYIYHHRVQMFGGSNIKKWIRIIVIN